MYALDAVVGLILLVGIVLLLLFIRRAVLTRGRGSFEMSYRLATRSQGRGWALGFGKYVGDDLQWFKVFGLGLRPRRVLARRELTVLDRRQPSGPELLALQSGMVVLRCAGGRGGPASMGGSSGNGEVEIAMSESALTGFLAWLESAAPGSIR